ncbi:Interferon-inducible GTPase 5, partial [Eschrichtius robustus]|nr:Interferon-inducible GTPase 5 [Eschrichtius robustus]
MLQVWLNAEDYASVRDSPPAPAPSESPVTMATAKLPAVPGEEENTILTAKEELEALRTAFESGDIPQAASCLRKLLASSESTRLEFPDVTLWDLPGAGSPGCPADKYLKQVDFGRNDFFLLVCPRRCGAVETRLASEILRRGKQFYFVRTEVGEDLAATRTQRPSGFSEAAVLQEMREHGAERLRAAGVNDPRVFPVSNLSPARYDFPLLVSTWEHDLPAPEQVLKTALVLGVIQALPGPRPAAAYDDALLMRSLRGYHRGFGLDDDSLAKLAEQVGKQAGDLRSVILSPLANEVSPETVLRLYSQSSDGAMRNAGGRGGISFGTVYTMLRGCLNEMAEDAQQVRIKALEEAGSQPEVSLQVAGDNGVEKRGSGEGSGEEGPLSTCQKLGLLLKYILDSWKKRDLSEDKWKCSPQPPASPTNQALSKPTKQTKEADVVKMRAAAAEGRGVEG